MRLKNFGLHMYRFRDNPEEKRFAEAWEQANERGSILDHLLDMRNAHIGRAPSASARDRTVAATVIQWLGSPVGQAWLRDIGYLREFRDGEPERGAVQLSDVRKPIERLRAVLSRTTYSVSNDQEK